MLSKTFFYMLYWCLLSLEGLSRQGEGMLARYDERKRCMMETKIYYELTKEARRIREEVFVKEQGFQEEFDGIDGAAKHIVLCDGERAVGTCRLFFQSDEQAYHVGRVAVVREYRGQGLGKILMDAAEACAEELGGAFISLSGQVRVAGFYEKLGYHREGSEYLDEGCPHVKMTKQLK